ncbi:head maturation protease, ClpP-related [Cupriavidus oxalaticus]|uniref:ATP-dependent Clp protease proteolytic subunit n=1 Tax=Cupriavidus oxalaticus TaxID=96344 RepID=A0A375GAS4_9BURK|nr:head maturation protease, ClpP-related [Cupriavidus oxalaticus]QRQ86256.1 ATP-dependent Clp protease proteolytic subunit [Cupriavidus oxalaticus]QRQ95417.1 ATP-dependent Clp protease proteolytic subunit [Cupriavidus oxalaticus]WQD84074.1 ATP-dependent Clp protease proteolytic subunit [Cupriavidus oxalaticus]SPC17388.1 putative ATP-dependent Clp protease proteolytic subunit [Cupriavidus oxalaticus]
MKNWYSITAKANTPEEADISIFDEIGFWGVTAKDFIADLSKITAKKINLSINSPGGSVFDALAIFNALRNSGKEIHVRVLGIAASAASYIMLAGDKIVMPENTFVMVHNPLAGMYGNAEEFREFADVLDKVGASLRATYVKRTGKSEEEIDALLSKDTYLTAAEAVEIGLADEMEPAMNVTASYETDRLPENVKAAFTAAQTPAAKTDPAPEPKQAAQEANATFADQVTALAEQAGLAEFATVWALDQSLGAVEAVTAAINDAREIKALCAVAKKPDAAAQFIKARTSTADVRAKLCSMLAEADEQQHIDTAPKGNSTATNPAQPVAVKTADIWAARRSR